MSEFIMSNDFWKSIYNEGIADFDPEQLPWNIGVPQPEITAIVDELSAPILDAGCGIGVTVNYCAAIGKDPVVGMDISEAAINRATSAAEKLGVSDKTTFVTADITDFSGFDGYFHSIVDSTLFHSLPIAAREGYQKSIYRAAAPGAKYVILVFAQDAWHRSDNIDNGVGPHAVSKEELESVISPYWIVDSIKPAFIHTRADSETIQSVGPITAQINSYDDHKRPQLAAWLAVTHKE